MKHKSLRTFLTRFAYLFTAIAILYLLVYFFIFRPLNTRYSSFHTLPILDQTNISPGYTLISPYNRMLTTDPKWHGTVYLLNMFGKAVHTWSTNHQALYSMLEPSGNLLAIMESPKYTAFFPPGGNTGTIEELDWNGNVVWEYHNEAMHHAIVPLKNGDILISLWEKTPASIASKIQGGYSGSTFQDTVWSDEIREINRKGNTVWSWHSYQHLDPSVDILDPTMPQYAWTYTNGMDYTEHNPIDGTPAVLLSMRSLDEIMLVRKSDGKIIWRSPKGMLNTQHDPSILANGNILVFDNSFTRPPTPFPSFGTKVVELNPKTNKIVWSFDGGKGVIDKMNFFAPIVGGAQRLANDDTLITDGPKGHIFEVTPKGKVVWDLQSPYTTEQTGAFLNAFLFRSRRYTADEVKFPSSLSPAFSAFQYTLYQVLQYMYPASFSSPVKHATTS